MLKINEIKEMITAIDQSSIQQFKLEYEGIKVVINKSNGQSIQPAAPIVVEQVHTIDSKPDAAPVINHTEAKSEPAAEQKNEDIHQVLAPMVGTFYSRSNPEAAPYVEVGTKVQKNTIVCMLEAMKLFNEIEAEVNGEIVEILVKDGQLIEYGQPLFSIKKA